MMKMVMKIQKSQVVQTDRTAGAVKTFRRTASIQAGFKTIDLMCIGGSGGYGTTTQLAYYPAGPGGGGGRKARVLLKDLTEEFTTYYGGLRGADSNVASGYDGQDSYFGPYRAYGGKGSSASQGGWGNPDVYAPIGGEGGGSAYDGVSPLEGGNGGHAPFGWGGLNYPYVAPENGPWVDLGGGNGHGGGGGGGAGRSNRSGYAHVASAGGYGGVSGAQAPPGTFLGGDWGGPGGGINLGLLTGVTEYIGTYTDGVTMFILS